MTSVRRRVLRPAAVNAEERRRQRRLQQKRQQLVKERTSLGRWMSRLKRAFHAMEKLQAKIARLEKQVAELEAEERALADSTSTRDR